MSEIEGKQIRTGLVGQLPSILLSPESNKTKTNLFAFSEDFYQQHKWVLPLGMGVVSGLWQPDQSGKRNLPPHEAIAFDALGHEDDVYGWQICYADSGSQQLVRITSTPKDISGDFIATDRAGAISKHHLLDTATLNAVKANLIERLQSPEVSDMIEHAYARRESVERAIAAMTLEHANLGTGASRRLQEQIGFLTKGLSTSGFIPQLIFSPSRLNHLKK